MVDSSRIPLKLGGLAVRILYCSHDPVLHSMTLSPVKDDMTLSTPHKHNEGIGESFVKEYVSQSVYNIIIII